MKKYIKPTSPKKATTRQPNKNEAANTKKRTTTKTKDTPTATKQKIYKSQKITPTKTSSVKDSVIRRNDTPKERKHPEYGTSKLEERFAKDFLDKLGIVYQTQFKAESIGRYYDFYLPEYNTLFEINGGYWHADPRLYEGKELTPVQKKSKKIDKIKYKWALEHKIPIYYFWEKDIIETPGEILKTVKEIIAKEQKHMLLQENKKKRPK